MILPYGQGKPLPPKIPYQGEWLVERFAFLYRSNGQAIGGDAPRFNVIHVTDAGTFSVGFDAAQLAAAFGVEVDDIFVGNRNGSLQIRGTNDATSMQAFPQPVTCSGSGANKRP